MNPTLTEVREWAHPFDIRLVHGQIRGEDRVLERATVRAVVMRGDRLLLVHSRVNGDLMFPGGGIEHGEAHDAALARELREECGAELVAVGCPQCTAMLEGVVEPRPLIKDIAELVADALLDDAVPAKSPIKREPAEVH